MSVIINMYIYIGHQEHTYKYVHLQLCLFMLHKTHYAPAVVYFSVSFLGVFLKAYVFHSLLDKSLTYKLVSYACLAVH